MTKEMDKLDIMYGVQKIPEYMMEVYIPERTLKEKIMDSIDSIFSFAINIFIDWLLIGAVIFAVGSWVMFFAHIMGFKIGF